MICKEIHNFKNFNVNTGMDTLIVERRNTWCFQVMCSTNELGKDIKKDYILLDENENILEDVEIFMKKVNDNPCRDWVLASNKRLIAFRNFVDRTIYIYSKKYFEERFSNAPSIFNCKSIVIE